MELLLRRPIIFFDVESTGVDPKTDRIIEIAAIKCWPDGRREQKCRRFNPLMPIPKEATAIHGITDADVLNEPPFAKVVKGERGILAFFAGCDLGGFNVVAFDIPILQEELGRVGEALDLSEISVIDVFKIFILKEPRHLSAAVEFYCGKTHDDAHSALGDITATLEVFEAQLARYPDLPKTPRELDLCVRSPEDVDRLGKLKWVNGEIVLTFGRYKGRSLKYLAREDPDYIHWMIENDVVTDAVGHLRDAVMGIFAEPPDDSGDS